MLIKNITVTNYRNLNDFSINSDSNIQYIFGDNGIGKSNLLELYNTIFNRNSFLESDFYDLNEKIKVDMALELNDLELGYFDELFEPTDEHEILVTITQDSPNGRIEFKHEESNSIIPYTKVKNIPFVYYNSVQAPDELNFSKSKTTGKFLNSIIQKYIETSNLTSSDLISIEKMNEIVENINKYIGRIGLIKNTGVSAKVENDSTQLIPKLIGLSNDDNISVNKMGAGVRYISYIFFEILNTILKSTENDNNIKFVDSDGRKFLPIIISLDEPEIHLHPYMQRNLMKEIRNILDNKDVEFSKLLKEYFGIDGLIGQIIIATHSPNILSNDYKEYIRICSRKNQIMAVSGSELNLGDCEKHLLQHMADIKESFFSKCVLLFEGISEAGSIPYFANKIGIDLDALGIGVIPANGEGSVRMVKKLLNKFEIEVVAVIDKDCYKASDISEGILSTKDKDLECDIVNKIIDNQAVNELVDVINEYEDNGSSVRIQKKALEKNNEKLGMNLVINCDYSVDEAISNDDSNILKLVLISWLWWKKDMIRGRILGQKISAVNIPIIYVEAIKLAEKKLKEEAVDETELTGISNETNGIETNE